MTAELKAGDCLERMREMSDASMDAVVTDPPYELGFMGKSWDASGIAYSVELWREVLRVLKPGGHLLAFGGTRTYHRMAVAIEDAGFEVRDSIDWIYGTGFPKSLDVAKAITAVEKHGGSSMRDLRKARMGEDYEPTLQEEPNGDTYDKKKLGRENDGRETALTETAQRWNGWGTALKPAHEPVVVARKPLVGTVADNVQAHGTGALNIDGCRVEGAPRNPGFKAPSSSGIWGGADNTALVGYESPSGRWPPNILLSHTPECDESCAEDCAVAEMDRQGDGASRFFPVFRYQAKASRSERGADNKHPTVKPVELMRWLVRLVTLPGGVVLDPFMGSGTTGVACVKENVSFVGIEREPQYLEICKARVEAARGMSQGGLFE